uniref:Uncharacterized protein n=1 Tax=Tanacetum cinerariifolium TaxID=118510 RepID=A0A6L2LZS2_TANCI|nr:hypothetical protein [Tanacetum cinerariifolium]
MSTKLLKKLTPEVLKSGPINKPKEFGDRHKLRGYSLAVLSHCHKKFVFKLRKRTVSFEMFSTPTLRNMMDGSGFRAGQWVRFYLSEDTTLKDGVIRFEVC